MNTVESQKLSIDSKAHSYAKIYSSLIEDEFQRKRAYASIVALYSFLNFAEKTSNNIQKAMTLFRNPKVNEQFEITDLYINNWHLDIRVLTGGSAVLLPKLHYEYSIVPDFYVVIKVDKELKTAELLGFVDTKTTQPDAYDYNYKSIPLDKLISYNTFLEKTKTEKPENYTEDDHIVFRENYLNFIDGNIKQQQQITFLKHLFNCSECRTEFCCFTGFEMVSCNASKYPEVLNDETLGIIGAQNVNDKKYEGKEEKIYIGDDKDNNKVEDIISEEEDIQEIVEDSDIDNIAETEPKENIIEAAEETINETETEENLIEEQEEETIAEIKEEELAETQEEENLTDTLDEESEKETEPDNNTDNNENTQLNEDEPQEQTVSDILDELFGEDEEFIDKEEYEDKPIETSLPAQSLVENNTDDFEIIPDINNEDIEILEESSPLKTLEAEDIIENIVESDEISPDLQEADLLLDNTSDIEYIDEASDEDTTVITGDITEKNTTVDESTNIQKVIVDYDEAGEPVYSYITSVDSEDDSDIDIYPDSIEEYETVYEEYKDTPEPETQEGTTAVQNTINEISTTQEDIKDIQDNVNGFSTTQDEITEEQDTVNGFSTTQDETLSAFSDSAEYPQYEDEKNVLNNDILESDESYEYNPDNTQENIHSKEEVVSNENIEMNNSEELDDNNNQENSEEEGELEEYEDYEEDDDEEKPKSSSKMAAIVVALILFVGLAGAAGSYMFFKNLHKTDTIASNTQPEINNENNNGENIQQGEEQNNNDFFEDENNNNDNPENNGNNENPENNDNQNNENNNPENQLTEEDLIQPQQENSANGNINKAIVNTFAQNRSGISFRELNWFCTSELFSDRAFKNYLQNLDNTLKQNLKNNLLNATETPQKDSVSAKFAVDNNGNLKKVIISDSCGSEEIDNIVLQSINESFEGEKSQILDDSTLKSDMYYLKVVIKI